MTAFFYLDIQTYGRLHENKSSTCVYQAFAHLDIVADTDAGTSTLNHAGVLTVVQSHDDEPRNTTGILLAAALPARYAGSYGGADHHARRAATRIDLPNILHHTATLATTVPMTIPLFDRVAWSIGAANQGDTYG